LATLQHARGTGPRWESPLPHARRGARGGRARLQRIRKRAGRRRTGLPAGRGRGGGGRGGRALGRQRRAQQREQDAQRGAARARVPAQVEEQALQLVLGQRLRQAQQRHQRRERLVVHLRALRWKLRVGRPTLPYCSWFLTSGCARRSSDTSVAGASSSTCARRAGRLGYGALPYPTSGAAAGITGGQGAAVARASGGRSMSSSAQWRAASWLSSSQPLRRA